MIPNDIVIVTRYRATRKKGKNKFEKNPKVDEVMRDNWPVEQKYVDRMNDQFDQGNNPFYFEIDSKKTKAYQEKFAENQERKKQEAEIRKAGDADKLKGLIQSATQPTEKESSTENPEAND